MGHSIRNRCDDVSLMASSLNNSVNSWNISASNVGDNHEPSLSRDGFEGAETRAYQLEQLMKLVQYKCIGSAEHSTIE